MDNRFEYRSSIDIDTLRDSIDQIISQSGELASSETRRAIRIIGTGSPLDSDTINLIIEIVAVPVIDTWKFLILPKLRQRWGDDVLREDETDGPVPNEGEK